MVRADNRYSRFVAWSKIALPLAALGLLSTIFLLSTGPVPQGQPPFAERGQEELGHDERVTRPNYAGVTEGGTALTVTAESARPREADDLVEIAAPRVTLETQGGEIVTVAAATGRVDTAARDVLLEGDVHVAAASGHEIDAGALRVALDRTEMESLGPVTATGPQVRIEAGRLAVRPRAGGSGVVVVFNAGVNLLYTPDPKERPAP